MSKGISTNQRLTQAQVTALSSAGIEFVFRYYASSPTNGKTLTAVEAQHLDAAGISLAVVYEQRGGADDHPEDFTQALAERDARAALSMATLVGQPRGSAIYFGVDHDFESQHFVETTLVNYFNRVAAIFRQENSGTLPYVLGVYGSGMVCRVLRAHCADVKYAWLAESTGWTESGSYQNWDVKQFLNHGQSIGNGAGKLTNYEVCESDADFGAFHLQGHSAVAVPSGTVASAEFSLELGASPALRTGLLSFMDAGGQKVLQVVATSGLKGKQTSGHLWAPGQGPLPDHQTYQIDTRLHFPEETSFTGAGFQILPESVQSPAGIVRGGFYLHGRENAAGTRGGIEISEPDALQKVSDLLASSRQAGTPVIPLTMKYTAQPTVDSVAPLTLGLPTQAVFSMELRRTANLINGSLALLDANGQEVFQARASSGLAGHQHREDLWLSNRGPIPDISVAKTIRTAEAWSDVLGWRFFITPEVFTSNHQTRSAFRVHKDGGTPGSAGCIVIRDEDNFQNFVM